MQTQNEFETMCEAVHKAAQRSSMAVLVVAGSAADDLGAQGLQIVANKAGRPVITDRNSEFHSGKIFRPVSA
jgi:hypothetical protein